MLAEIFDRSVGRFVIAVGFAHALQHDPAVGSLVFGERFGFAGRRRGFVGIDFCRGWRFVLLPDWHRQELESKLILAGRRVCGPAPPIGPGVGVIDAAMKDLACPQRDISVCFEILRHADEIGMCVAEPSAIAQHAGVGGRPAGEHRAARRIAKRILAIGVIEAHAGRSKPVEIGRLCHRACITSQFGAQVVGNDK